MKSVIEIMQEATKDSSFNNHAAKELSLENKLLYLQGLALVMKADGEIHEEEKDYLLILIKSLELDESFLEDCVDFANEPNKGVINSIFKAFKRKPITQLFLFDAWMMSYRDGDISAAEKAVIDEFASQFEVTRGIYNDAYDLFCHIKNKNWQNCAMYFSPHMLNPEFFQHILDYYEVDLDTILQENNAVTKRRILANILSKNKDGICNEVLLPFLQSKLDRKEAKVQNDVLIIPELKDLELASINLEYNQLDDFLYIESPCLVEEKSIVDYFFESIDLGEVNCSEKAEADKLVISTNAESLARILSRSW